jgi:plasmid stabilization system protein ParE
MKLIVSGAAVADLERLHAFLADKNPRAAGRAVTTLVAAVESLSHFPERGRPAGVPNTRELIVPFGRSNYVVRYAHRTGADELVIFRIWHGREARE